MTQPQNQEMISIEQMQSLFDIEEENPEEKKETPETEDESFNLNGEQEEQEEPQQTTPPEQPRETETEQEGAESTPNQNTTFLSNTVKSLVNDGIWEDLSIKYEDKEYDSLLDLVDEVEVTEDFFKGLLSTQTEGIKKQMEEKSVFLKDDLDPVRADLVKAIASGMTDYEPFVESYDNVIEPLKKLDLSEERNSTALIAKYYKEVNQWDDDYISHKLKKHKENLDVEDTAEDIRKNYISSYQQLLEEKNKAYKEEEQTKIAQEKEAKKEFKQSLKEREYSDPFISKAISLMHSQDKGVPNWQKELTTRLEDKDFKSEFTHWLLDPEDYINKKMAPKKREEKLKNAKNYIEVIGKGKKKTNTVEDKEDKDSDLLDIKVN